MKIKIEEVRTRILEVPTDNFNEAKKMAIAMLENEPMNDGDSNGIQFFSL